MGVLLGLSTAAFLLFLNGPDIVASHEARVALPARLMADSGWPWRARPVLVQPVVLSVKAHVLRLTPDRAADPVGVNPWLLPVLSGQVRLQKPPLPYWIAAISFRLLGGFSETTVRLAPALLGALATLLMYDLGRVLYGRQIGWLAALTWVSTYAIPEEYRKAMADPYLAFFTLACIWSWARASRAETIRSPNATESRHHKVDPRISANLHESTRIDRAEATESTEKKTLDCSSASSMPPSALRDLFVLVFYLSLGFALLAKGPAAFIDILLPLVAFHVCLPSAVPRRVWVHAAGVGLMLAVALPWPMYVWLNMPHAIKLWRYESVGEMGDNTENARPWFFYIPQLFYLALPWTALWVAAIARQVVRGRRGHAERVRRRVLEAEARRGSKLFAPTAAVSQRRTGSSADDDPTPPDPESGRAKTPQPVSARPDWRSFFPLLWYGLTVVFFSLVHLKKNQYLLPALPAQALLVAQAMSLVLAAGRKVRTRAAAVALMTFQTMLGIGFGIAMIALIQKNRGLQGVNLAGVVIAQTIAALPLWAIHARRFRAWPLAQAAAYVALFLAFSQLYLSPAEAQRSAKPVAAEVTELLRHPGYTLLRGPVPEEVAVYLPSSIGYDYHSAHVLVILDDQHDVNMRKKQPGEIPTPNLRNWVPDGKVMEIKRVPLQAASGDSRWKVWELTVDRKVFADGRNSSRMRQALRAHF